MGNTTTTTKIKNHGNNYKQDDIAVTVRMDYFERKLDDKRRLSIPAEARAEFASGVVVTKGFEKYLHMYALSVWETQVEPALKGSILDERVADLNVRFRSGKNIQAMDEKQGRIVIEQHLLDYAGITSKSVITAVRAGQYWRISAV